MLTNKENYLRMMRGEIPESIPKFSFANMVGPSILSKDQDEHRAGFDCFGVEYVYEPTIGGSIPKPGKFMFTDVTKWREYVKIPDLSGVDWESMAKEDLKKINTEAEPVVASFITGFFQNFINYMGFTEGLLAVAEEPDEIVELMEVTTDFYIEVAKKMVQYYHPEMVWMPDDIATARAPFVSLNSFRNVFKPAWKRFIDYFASEGIPTQLHCCGQCMPLVDDWVQMGIAAWDPVQTSNDVLAIKAKYGRKLALIGGFDTAELAGETGDTEEQVRARTHAKIDELAKDGGFAVFGAAAPPPNAADAKPPETCPAMLAHDPEKLKRIGWVMNEIEIMADGYYNK